MTCDISGCKKEAVVKVLIGETEEMPMCADCLRYEGIERDWW